MMVGMRNAYAMLLGLLVGPMALAAQTPVDRRAEVSPRASIRIQNLVGSTRIVAWDRDSLVLTGTVPRSASVYFGTGASGSAAKVGIETPVDGAGGPAHLELRVPRRARVWVKSATADIEVSGVEGGLDLYAVSGTIVVRGRPSELTAESMDGAVTVEDAAPWTRVRTASGAVTVTGGDDLVLTSVSGTVVYRGTGFRRAHLESVSGDIDVTGAPDRTGRLEVESHSGRVMLALPAGTGAEMDVQTLYGEIRNVFTDVRPRRLPDLQGWDLLFTAGGGGPDIVVRTFKGPIEIR